MTARWFFDAVPRPCGAAVEVGCLRGWWSAHFLRAVPEARLWCVDSWPNDERGRSEWGLGDRNYLLWLEAVRPWLFSRVAPLRCLSVVAAAAVPEPLDLVFVDADHWPDAVERDCRAWFPKLRAGGVLVGHDWAGRWGRQVRTGATRVFPRDCIHVEQLYVDPAAPDHPTYHFMVWRGYGGMPCATPPPK